MFIFGLGNPGKEYTRTRHNVGFRVLDSLHEAINASGWAFEKKMNAEISEGMIDSQKIMLVKPQTYMNLSGEVAAMLKKYKNLEVEDVLVIYDDKDLPFGSVRIRADGSSGGHNGMESMIQHLGTANVKRIRIGIAPQFELESANTADYVLGKFSKDE